MLDESEREAIAERYPRARYHASGGDLQSDSSLRGAGVEAHSPGYGKTAAARRVIPMTPRVRVVLESRRDAQRP